MLYYLVLIAFNFQPLIFRWFLFNKKLKGKLKKMILNFFKKDFGSKYEIPVTRSRCFIGYQAKIGMTEKGKWSVDFDKRSYSQLSLDERSKARGSIFSLSSVGLTRRSINKDFNIMDSCVYANASHENDILKVSSLSKEQYPSIQEPIPIISPLHKLTTSLLSLSKITLSLLSLGKCRKSRGSIFSLSSLGLTRGSIRQHIRFITLICGVLLTSTVATADDTTVETCANGAGTVVIGAVTEHKYCRSNKGMNWWNAVAWCDGQSKRLLQLDDCKFNSTASPWICPDLVQVEKSETYFWTMNPTTETRMYLIQQPSGNIFNSYGGDRHLSHYHVLCK